jgi:hypothetical protein
MKNTIKRLTDSKYLVSAEADTWTANIAEATQFSDARVIVTKIKILTRLAVTDILVEPVVPVVPETPVTPEPLVVDTPPTENNAPIVEPPAPDMSAPTN